MKCKMCSEEYSEEDLSELKEMGEHFYRDKNCYICPDCWDIYDRMDLEEKLKFLIKEVKQ